MRYTPADGAGDLFGVADEQSTQDSHCSRGILMIGPLMVIAPTMSATESKTGAASPEILPSTSSACYLDDPAPSFTLATMTTVARRR